MTELNELAPALVAAQAEFDAVPKDSDNPFYKSKYASLATVVKTAAPILKAHGLAVTQHIGWTGEHDVLTTMVLHVSGQFLKETMRLHLVKDDPQGQGSAVTYARRYAYMAALGLVADEDDDGNAASQKPVRGYQDAKDAHPAQSTRKPPELKPVPGAIPVGKAKNRLLEAFEAAGVAPLEARSKAAGVWARHKMGSGLVEPAKLDELLAEIQAEGEG